MILVWLVFNFVFLIKTPKYTLIKYKLTNILLNKNSKLKSMSQCTVNIYRLSSLRDQLLTYF